MDDMGFLILSEGGDGLGMALRLKEEGHKVSMYIRDPELDSRGEGLVDKGQEVDFNPVMVSDCTGSGALFDAYRDAGILTFCGSKVADKLETDRKYTSQILKECKIKQPKSKEFTSWEDAESFIQKQDNETRLVFKPEGKFSGNLPSYVSEDNEDLIGMFKHFKTLIEGEPEFLLQEFIPGICISSEAWYSIDHFIKPFNHTLERKQFMNGDVGPSGGCTGNVVWACEDEDCELCKEFYKLEDFLKEVSYNGPIDINFVVSEENGTPYALEFTPRFGYDAFPTLLYGLFDGNFGEFIWNCARGAGPDTMPLRSGFAAGVRISVPPWPSENFKSKAGLPIRGLKPKDFVQFYPYEVSILEDELRTSGGVGIIGICVGYSDNLMSEAFEDAYKIAEKIQLSDKQYRTDLNEAFKKDLRLLSRGMTLKI